MMDRERILQWAVQVWGPLGNNVNADSWLNNLDKFAKLAAAECVDILKRPDFIMKLSQTELSEYNQGWVNGRLLAIERIKEHFGDENTYKRYQSLCSDKRVNLTGNE
jgi:hypothetical protein